MTGDVPLRLLISDIDGTLVRSDKSLADATVEAVRRLTTAGLPVSLISARPASGMRWIAEKLGLEGPFGAFNGGVLFMADGTVIERCFIDCAVAHTMISLIADAKITCWVFADDQWFSNNADDPHTRREIASANVEPNITNDFSDLIERADKIVGVSDDHAMLADLEIRAIAAGQGKATIARSQPYYLDITAKIANKGDGITYLAKAFGVEMGEVAVIGDQANDLPMFARAGLSIVMGQAPAPVKAQAMIATDSNDDDGVASAISNIILPRVLR